MVPMDLQVVGGGVQIPAYFKLMNRGRYISALQLKGRTITWSSGTYGHAGFYGVWNGPSSMHPKGFIAMFWKKTHTASMIACYPNLDL
jgi:hypothetical protein